MDANLVAGAVGGMAINGFYGAGFHNLLIGAAGGIIGEFLGAQMFTIGGNLAIPALMGVAGAVLFDKFLLS
jgi:hypothetical protein